VAQILGGQLDLKRAGVLFQIIAALGAGDREEVLALREQPRERQLARCAFFLLGDASTRFTKSMLF